MVERIVPRWNLGEGIRERSWTGLVSSDARERVRELSGLSLTEQRAVSATARGAQKLWQENFAKEWAEAGKPGEPQDWKLLSVGKSLRDQIIFGRLIVRLGRKPYFNQKTKEVNIAHPKVTIREVPSEQFNDTIRSSAVAYIEVKTALEHGEDINDAKINAIAATIHASWIKAHPERREDAVPFGALSKLNQESDRIFVRVALKQFTKRLRRRVR